MSLQDDQLNNRSRSYKIAKYASGPFKDKWVVIRVTTEDVAAYHTEAAATELMRALEKANGCGS